MPSTDSPLLSVVIPVYNERDNIEPLCAELDAALAKTPFEVVYVDDGSTDDTLAQLQTLQGRFAWLKVVAHPNNAGQSAAFCSGVARARGRLIATLDGDGQNDPADIPGLIALWEARQTDHGGHLMVAGERAKRRDSWVRIVSSRVANNVRRWLLDDGCNDTGCSLKLFQRADYLLLPQFDHMHRFLPALFAREGITVINHAVNHRPRSAGVSKYGVGNRLWVGITDLWGARWLKKRRIRLPPSFRQPKEDQS